MFLREQLTEEELIEILRRGADGIMSDQPEVAINAVKKYKTARNN
jgi:hypothetical protein